jgi:POT family proton-dependent oligopeptide transporter
MSTPSDPTKRDDSAAIRKDYQLHAPVRKEGIAGESETSIAAGPPLETAIRPDITQGPTLFGHPTGLFTLFFAEMWERFSYYGMRALLVLYMVEGFLGYNDKNAYTIYGSYTALVYMTPFFGGMLADKLLGARRAVILGGLLMAGGQLMMTVQNEFAFFTALALLITGNGFFKPNISTQVGSLYRQGNPKRDGGFTIFYMGINLGAAMSPLLCGYIGQTYGWQYGFGLAAIGMLGGLAVFVAPNRVTQLLILAGSLAAAGGLFWYHANDLFSIAINVFVALSLLSAAVVAWMALARGGLPPETGAPPNPQRLHEPVAGPLRASDVVYLGALIAIPIFLLLVSGFAPFLESHRPITLFPEKTINDLQGSENPLLKVLGVVVEEVSKPAGLILVLVGLLAFGYVGVQTARLERIPRERMCVVLFLTFFSMLFWAVFEQAGSSLNLFTDRNVDRVFEDRKITEDDVGKTYTMRVELRSSDAEISKLPLLSQEHLGYQYGNSSLKEKIEEAIRTEQKRKDKKPEDIEKLVKAVTQENLFTFTALSNLREAVKNAKDDEKKKFQTVEWLVIKDNVGMGFGGSENPASIFQALNPVYILLFGVVFTALWSFLGARGLEPNTPVKFALGLVQLGLGFGVIWYGAQMADQRGMVALSWLFLGYLLHTTGELCISPVGLSMVTKMSPRFLVNTVMGMWFLATAFSQLIMAIIAQFTSVGDSGAIPPPKDTVHIYGDVFGNLAIAMLVAALICFLVSPLLKRWMHEGVKVEVG